SSSGYVLNAGPMTPGSVTAGSTPQPTSVIVVTPENGYTGTVNLSCAVAGGTPTPTCAFNPAQVVITNAATKSSTLTVTTTLSSTPGNSTPGGTYTVTVTASDTASQPPINGAQVV